MRKVSMLFFLSVSVITVLGQKEDSAFIKKISDEILTNGKAYENLRHLTKKIGARLAGSQGMVKSEQWGLKIMQESGADKAYRQECMVPHWVRGGTDFAQAGYTIPASKTKNMIPQKKGLDIVALGNSVGDLVADIAIARISPQMVRCPPS